MIRQLPLGACEARFGPMYPGEEAGTLSRDEPIEIDLGGRTLRLAGRIDRITGDAEPPTRFRVIDYKTGQVREEKPAQQQRSARSKAITTLGPVLPFGAQPADRWALSRSAPCNTNVTLEDVGGEHSCSPC
jgi:hypothetical protein